MKNENASFDSERGKPNAVAHGIIMATAVRVIEKLGVDAFVPDRSISVPFCSHGKLALIMY